MSVIGIVWALSIGVASAIFAQIMAADANTTFRDYGIIPVRALNHLNAARNERGFAESRAIIEKGAVLIWRTGEITLSLFLILVMADAATAAVVLLHDGPFWVLLVVGICTAVTLVNVYVALGRYAVVIASLARADSSAVRLWTDLRRAGALREKELEEDKR